MNKYLTPRFPVSVFSGKPSSVTCRQNVMGLVKGRTATKARTEERDKIRRVRRRTVVQQPSQALDKRTIESVGKRALRTPSPLSCGCVVKGKRTPFDLTFELKLMPLSSSFVIGWK